jgi:hypothetical protein
VTICTWPKCGYEVVSDDYGLCYYHGKLRSGLIVPLVKRTVRVAA